MQGRAARKTRFGAGRACSCAPGCIICGATSASRESPMIARYIPSTRLAAIGAALAVLVIVLDQATKLWILNGLGFMPLSRSIVARVVRPRP